MQRERRYDEDFDHELRLALSLPPDPLKLMQAAARTHWRAAAWLLERTQPEQYARRSNNMANAAQVNHAVNAVMEAVLRALPPEQQERLFPLIDAACQRALDCCFPNLGPWGHPRSPKLPQTPLGNHLRWKMLAQAPGVPAFLNDEDRELAEAFIKEAEEEAQRAEGFISSKPEEPDDDATVLENAPASLALQPSTEDLHARAVSEALAEFDHDCHEQTGCAPGKQHCHAINQVSPCGERQHPNHSPAVARSPEQAPPREDQDNFVAKNAISDKMPQATEFPPTQDRRQST